MSSEKMFSQEAATMTKTGWNREFKELFKVYAKLRLGSLEREREREREKWDSKNTERNQTSKKRLATFLLGLLRQRRRRGRGGKKSISV